MPTESDHGARDANVLVRRANGVNFCGDHPERFNLTAM
jgi:hypothetical protein